MRKQRVKSVFPTENGPPAETKTPATAATGAGAKFGTKEFTQADEYPSLQISARPVRVWTIGPDLLVVAFAVVNQACGRVS